MVACNPSQLSAQVTLLLWLLMQQHLQYTSACVHVDIIPQAVSAVMHAAVLSQSDTTSIYGAHAPVPLVQLEPFTLLDSVFVTTLPSTRNMLHIQTLLAAEQDRQASFNCLLDQITTQQQQQHQQQDLQQQQHSQPRKPNTASNMDNHQHTLVVHGVSLGCTAGVDTAHDDTRYQVGRRQLLQLTGNSSTPGVTADDTTLMTTKHNNTTSSSSSSRHSISSVDSSAGAGGTDAAGGAGSSTSSSHLLPYRIIGGVQALKDR